jgi:hypothetical protein
MEASTIVFIAVAFLITLMILFIIIRMAILSATNDLAKDINLLTKLKMIEMKKAGYGAEVKRILQITQDIEHLQKQKKDGYITNAQFQQKKSELLAFEQNLS